MFDRHAPTAPAAPAGPVAKRANGRAAAPGTARRSGGAGTTVAGSELVWQVDELVSGTRELAEVDLSPLTARDKDRLLRQQSRLESAVAAWRSRLVASCDEQVLGEAGVTDKAGLLRRRLGMSSAEAKRQATLADGLAQLPGTSEALAEGRISSDSARRIADAADDGTLGTSEKVEATLLDPATRMDPDQLGRLIRRRQEAARSDAGHQARERHALAKRGVWKRKRPDGLVERLLLLPQHADAMLDTALARYVTIDGADTPQEARRTFPQRNADAFVDMVQASLDAPREGPTSRTRPEVTVMVPWEVATGGAGIAEVNGAPVSAELARRIACDAWITRLVVDAASLPLDVGRASRSWSIAQRKAVIARDGHCRGPGCDRPAAWCDIHHIAWWERDHGPTDIDNGILLCHRHHDLTHHSSWTVQLHPLTADAIWTSPTGSVCVTHPEGAAHTLLEPDEPPTNTGPPVGDSRLGAADAGSAAQQTRSSATHGSPRATDDPAPSPPTTPPPSAPPTSSPWTAPSPALLDNCKAFIAPGSDRAGRRVA